MRPSRFSSGNPGGPVRTPGPLRFPSQPSVATRTPATGAPLVTQRPSLGTARPQVRIPNFKIGPHVATPVGPGGVNPNGQRSFSKPIIPTGPIQLGTRGVLGKPGHVVLGKPTIPTGPIIPGKPLGGNKPNKPPVVVVVRPPPPVVIGSPPVVVAPGDGTPVYDPPAPAPVEYPPVETPAPVYDPPAPATVYAPPPPAVAPSVAALPPGQQPPPSQPPQTQPPEAQPTEARPLTGQPPSGQPPVAALPPGQAPPDRPPTEQPASGQPAEAPSGQGGTFVTVSFQPNISNDDVDTFLKAYNVAIAEGPNAQGLYRIQLSDGQLPPDQVQQVVASMQSQTAIVASVAPD